MGIYTKTISSSRGSGVKRGQNLLRIYNFTIRMIFIVVYILVPPAILVPPPPLPDQNSIGTTTTCSYIILLACLSQCPCRISKYQPTTTIEDVAEKNGN